MENLKTIKNFEIPEGIEMKKMNIKINNYKDIKNIFIKSNSNEIRKRKIH